MKAAGCKIPAGLGLFLLLSSLAFSQVAGKVAASNRPNVVVIVADDQGYADLGVQGIKDVTTPNIDSLAKNGVRFTNGYVSSPMCSPSRAGFITGRYQTRFGHETNPMRKDAQKFGLPLDQVTFANYMKNSGYVTGMVGKWHLGMRPLYRPNRRGFDEFFGFLGGAHTFKPRSGSKPGNDIRRNDTPVEEHEYLTSAFAREAVSFIDRHSSAPFFLYVPFNDIHTPLQATPERLAKYAGIKDPVRRAAAAKIDALDDAVGRILHEIDKKKLTDKTLIFFFSDNGGPTGANGSLNTPLSGYKGQVLEGGIRIPFIVQWKSKIPAGKVYTKPVISLDILPTSLAATGTTVPHSAKLDGVNLLPFLEGTDPSIPHKKLYWRHGDENAIRDGDWKYVKSSGTDDHWRLFNLATDISEKNDLSTSKPEIAQRLKTEYDKWDELNVAPLWTVSKFHPKVDPDSKPGIKAKPGKKARKRNRQMAPLDKGE